MRIRLKGLNSKRKKLADGSFRTYYWAWKGGPPLCGEPGTPEFVASYNAAVAAKVIPPNGVLFRLLQDYQASDNFRSRRDRTRHDYVQQIKRIERDLGDFPLSALTDRRTRGVFMAWRDKLALSSRRQADYGWQVLALVLAWAKERGKITINPCERGGRLYRGNRVDKIWSDDDEGCVPADGTGYPTPAAVDGVMDRTTSRRPVAVDMVSLRRNADALAPIQDWQAGQL
jgi:hypothetical protein